MSDVRFKQNINAANNNENNVIQVGLSKTDLKLIN